MPPPQAKNELSWHESSFQKKKNNNTTINLEKPLTNLQVELPKLFARNVPEDKLLAIKELISVFLLEAARDEADKTWEQKGYSDTTVKEWLHKK